MAKDAGVNFLVHLCDGMDLVSFDGKKAIYRLEVDEQTHTILSVVGADWAEYEPDPPEMEVDEENTVDA